MVVQNIWRIKDNRPFLKKNPDLSLLSNMNPHSILIIFTPVDILNLKFPPWVSESYDRSIDCIIFGYLAFVPCYDCLSVYSYLWYIFHYIMSEAPLKTCLSFNQSVNHSVIDSLYCIIIKGMLLFDITDLYFLTVWI